MGSPKDITIQAGQILQSPFFAGNCATYLEEGQHEEVEVGKLGELVEEVCGQECEPVVLACADLVIREAILRSLALVVDHEVARMSSCYFLVLLIFAPAV